MSPDQDKEKESKLGLPTMFTSKVPKCPYERVLALKSVWRSFFRATQGRNPMLARGDEGGRATVHNVRLARRF